MLRKSPLSLACRADANPVAEFHLYFNGRLIITDSSGIFNVTVMSDGFLDARQVIGPTKSVRYKYC